MPDPILPSARWAVFGAGVISGDFARALRHARLGGLHAVASRDTARAEAFAAEHGAPIVGGYDDILTRNDIDAVYIGTVHTTHAERTGLPLVEAFKYRFGPFPERMRQLIADDELGDVLEIESSIGFDAGDRTGRLFDPETAGGAILDAGCYPVSLAVGVAAWAGRLGAVSVVEAEGVVGTVDEQASAVLDLDGIRARVRTAITADLPRRAVIRGTEGELEVPNVWGSRTASTDTAILRRVDGTSERVTADVVQPMAAEADATVLALREGRTQTPEMPWFETLATARLLADWRAAL